MENIQMVRPLKDKVILRANPSKNAVKELAPGVEIIIDQTWEKHATEHVTQDGVVVSIPRALSKFYKVEIGDLDIEIEPGDHVYTHHFLCSTPHGDEGLDESGYGLFSLLYGLIHCIVKDGKINMIGNWNLIDPIKEKAPESKSGIITKVGTTYEQLKGKALHINKELRGLGVKEGDVIYFDQDSDYPIIIEGKTYYRMENRFILGIAN